MNSQNSSGLKFTHEEVSKHNEIEDCWVIIEDRVYDVTSFLEHHPGGYDVILDCAGSDATESFFNFGHSDYAERLIGSYFVGILEKSAT